MMPAPAEDLARPHELGYFDLSETYSVLGTALSHRKPERHFISSSPLRAPIEPVAASPVYKVSFRAQYWPTSQPKPLTISPISHDEKPAHAILMQPKVYISYSPGNSGAVFALLYCGGGADIYGWHVEARNTYFSAAFFMVEDFYSSGALRLYRSVEDDVYSLWTIDCPPTREKIRSPLPDAMAHELERVQSAFVDEWLFFRHDDRIDAELAAYPARGLPIQEVNIKSRRLDRLHKTNSGWVYLSQGLDPGVTQLLRKYWRLNEKLSNC